MKKRILIVEDEIQIIKFIKNRLDENIFDIDISTDGKDAISKVKSNRYDLITLDIMLPSINGFDICKETRANSRDTFIIIVSAINKEEDKLKGYELGADDYISKPFSPRELSAKIKALFKRSQEIQINNSKFNKNIMINYDSKEIYINSFKLKLTPSEYLIFEILFKYHNKVFSREELSQLIYDNNYGNIDTRGIDSHIYHIRKKTKLFESKEIIKTVRGIGYKIYEN